MALFWDRVVRLGIDFRVVVLRISHGQPRGMNCLPYSSSDSVFPAIARVMEGIGCGSWHIKRIEMLVKTTLVIVAVVAVLMVVQAHHSTVPIKFHLSNLDKVECLHAHHSSAPSSTYENL
ncbi:hypothetical protein VNO77_00321 [Canavalia gladiata]|uniref:Uncharacterized protein n=1 Tax=Canavalia gladiata TaxID=3824 RepID=A0AAN9MPD6_CANGL